MTTLPHPPAPAAPAAWRRALVYGLGLSGRSAVRLLRRRGVEVVAVDDRPAAELELGDLAADRGIELHCGGELSRPPEGIDLLVVSPGVPPDRPLLAAARGRVPILSEVELAFPFLDGPVVAVTGSNGKSTTTALAGAMLHAAGFDARVCGNIGTPLSAEVGRPREVGERIFVVELSSFQLENVHAFRARAAAFLNLAPDHMDRYASLEDYGAAKRSLFALQEEGDVAVLNRDDARAAATPTRARRRFFSRLEEVEDGCHLAGDRVLEVAPGGGGEELFRRRDVPLAGEHNLENAMAAALLARAFGTPPEALRAALGGFRGLPHRMEKVREVAGVAWFDDSKGTNPAATARSLEGLPDGAVHLILGGRNKGADPAELAPWVRRKAARVYLIGEAAAELEAALAGEAPCERAGTLERAVSAAAARAHAGEVVLLSPACASFDQFRNFSERGERFQALVRDLAGGPRGQEAGV